jgi:hypothetical protein
MMDRRLATIFFMLALASLAFAQPALGQKPFFDYVIEQVDFFTIVSVILMITLVVMAGVVYSAGQLFGAETRAKTSQYAQGILVAVGLALAVFIVMNTLMPGYLQGEPPSSSITGGDIQDMVKDLLELAKTGFGLLIMTSLVLAAAMYAAGQLFGAETRARAHQYGSMIFSAAVLTSIIYVILFEVVFPLGGTFFVGTVLGIYGGLLILVVILISIVILITYVLSRIFKVPEWEAYLNVEMSNLMTSFLMVLFVIGLFAISAQISNAMTGGVTDSPPQAAIVYMQGTVADSALRASIDVYKINACTSMMSTFNKRIGEYVLTQTYKIFPGLDTFVNITNTLGFTLLTLYNTVSVQIGLLYFADATMQYFFLPAGLVLRFFPPTRDAGAFLIALAFGFQIVFPTLYMVNKLAYDEIYANEPDKGIYRSPDILIQSVCGPFKYGLWGYILNPASSPLLSMANTGPWGASLMGTLSGLVNEGVLNMMSMAEFVPIMKNIAALSLMTLFSPALALLVTIASINAMTKFIVLKG